MKKIINKRDLAITLSNNRSVNIVNVSKRLHSTIKMWESYGDVKIQNDKIIGCF